MKYKILLRSSSSRRVSAMLNACQVSPGHEVRPWNYNIVDFYTNYTHSCSNCYIIKSDLTDHFPLTVKIHQKLTKKQNPIKFVRSLKNFDKDKFCDDVEEACIQNINSSQSINEQIDILLHVIHTAMNQHMPLRKLSRKQTKLQEKPWLTSGFLKSIKNKNKMFSALCKVKFQNKALQQKYKCY